ncbi:hypothetical protein F511_24702 [Dorcoceras hygrometricum]|uniref:Uncharacterized protein n=1 Tax=Dorcoceras hygrometricum TaxID=472368 RepID=A0A2Z7BK11_9LAMI|nr:hypothetical protein F511_24702 [Dorcoceras hygrometricum]
MKLRNTTTGTLFEFTVVVIDLKQIGKRSKTTTIKQTSRNRWPFDKHPHTTADSDSSSRLPRNRLTCTKKASEPRGSASKTESNKSTTCYHGYLAGRGVEPVGGAPGAPPLQDSRHPPPIAAPSKISRNLVIQRRFCPDLASSTSIEHAEPLDSLGLNGAGDDPVDFMPTGGEDSERLSQQYPVTTMMSLFCYDMLFRY